MKIHLFLSILSVALVCPVGSVLAQEPSKRGRVADNWDEAYKRLRPLADKSRLKGPHPTTEGKVLTGYQGWFAAEGDGSGISWQHFGGRRLGPGHCSFDLWPDLSELGKDELYPSPFKMEDGSTAPLFSSYHPATVGRHFKWMKDYGIDAAMLQRFGANLKSPRSFDFNTAVMENVRNGAELHGRAWAVMYDLSGLQKGEALSVIREDWKRLVDQAKVLEDRTYLHHAGKPLVAVWGIGFNDNRQYTVEECRDLVDFLKSDPKYGGNSVMIGVPYYWRNLSNDTLKDPLVHEVIKKADIVSPWAVGRYASVEAVEKNVPGRLEGDLSWCKDEELAYLPVIFPGFSWQNLQKSRGRNSPLNQTKREGGKFLWSQGLEVARAGCSMVYVAMFDEIDEGTAIMKGSNVAPVGDSKFMTYEGLPEDHYLWLTGQIGKMVRKEIPKSANLPKRR